MTLFDRIKKRIGKSNFYLPDVLKIYSNSNFAVQQKARVFYYICLAAIVGLIMLTFSSASVQLSGPSGKIMPLIIIPEIFLVLIFFYCIRLLLNGKFNFSTHLFMISSNITVWYVMWINKGELITKFDTVVIILALINVIPLFIIKYRWTVFLYVVLNLVLLSLFVFFNRNQHGIDNSIIIDFLADTSISIIFSGLAVYQIIKINNRSLERVEQDYKERKKAESDLAITEERYKTLIEASKDGIILIDLNGNILFVNNRFSEMVRIEPKNITVGTSILTFFNEKDRAIVKSVLPQLSHLGHIENLLVSGLRSDGTSFPAEINFMIVMNSDGILNNIMVNVRDISKRIKAEEALKQNELFRRRVFDSSKIPIVIMESTNFKFIDINNAAIDIYGFISKDSALGKTPFDVSSPFQYDGYPSSELAKKNIQKALNEGSVTFEWLHQRPNGEFWDAEVHLLSFDLNDQKLLQFSLIDITERKKTEKELKESEEKYRTLMESLNDVIMMVDNDDKVLYINKNFTEKLGYAPDEIVGKIGYQVLVDKEHHDSIIKANQERRKKETSHYEMQFIAKNGSRIDFLISGAPVVNAEGETIGSIGAMVDITDRKEAEKALKESEGKYRTLMESMNEVIMMVDNEDRVQYINRRFTEKLGYLPEEIIGEIGYKLLYSKDELNTINNASQSRDKNQVSQYELSFAAKDGHKITFLVSAAPITNSFGRSAGFILAMVDITDRKKAEKDLKESEEKYRTIIEVFPDIIMISDLNGNIIFANKVLEKITGITPVDYNNKNRKATIHPDDVPFVQEQINKLLAGNIAHTDLIENRFIDTWGNLHWFSGIMSKLEINNQFYLQTITRDITEKKNIEQELENYRKHLEFLVQERTDELATANEELTSTNDELLNQREELEAVLNNLQVVQEQLVEEKRMVDSLMDNIPDAIYFKDLDSRFIKVSKCMDSKEGMKETLIGKTDFDLFTLEHAQPAFDTEQTIIKTGTSVIDLVEKETWKDGNVTYASTTKMPLRDASGEIIGTFGISRDITKMIQLEHEIKQQNDELNIQRKELEKALNTLKEAQNKLVHSEKMASLGLLASGVAHEINNPLNFIKGGVLGIESFINDNYKEHLDELAPLIEGMNVGVERAATIVESLNHYNRRDDLPFIKCDIHSVINNCLVMLQNQIKNRIEVVKDFTSKKYELYCNEGKIHQAMLNIIANAVQSITDKGKIKIFTYLKNKTIQIEIKDTGCGMSKEILPKIMDPFFTTKEPGKGTGLGLSITYNIIQEHNGSLTFESKLNKGTTVKIILPLNKKNDE